MDAMDAGTPPTYGNDEAVLGFPVEDLSAVASHLEYLAEKAIPVFQKQKGLCLAFQKKWRG
jgi:hypothetical protein